MCGGTVSASATECPSCGESFAPTTNGSSEPFAPTATSSDELAVPTDGLSEPFAPTADDSTEPLGPEEEVGEPPAPASGEDDSVEETVTEVTEEYEVPEAQPSEPGRCKECDGILAPDGTCPTCSGEAPKDISKGCPVCGNSEYTVESGNLVACNECGNVYVRPQYEEKPQSWKWKFWVGLVFILFGNVGVALGSYVHNVVQWSPLGALYLGYGWIDQAVGILGIVIFILGLILFAWSFKREREVTCPSCKVTVREGDLTIYIPEETEEVPESAAIESALEEIGEMAECPTCGVAVSIFDTTCPNCGEVFDLKIQEPSETPEQPPEAPEQPPEEPSEPGKLLKGSEIDQDEIIMDSLELETPENGLNGDSLEALSELESAFDASVEKNQGGVTCSTCGARVGQGIDTCPGCGAAIPVKRKKGGE